jgi:hypothetical protein
MTEYDLAHRERIREALLAYMKEHKIGVPRLAARIKETVHRNPEIPVKTLQRFMKGEVRTIDMHVGFLSQFAEKVSKADVMPRLGYALSAFYSSKDKTDWSGSFEAMETEASNADHREIYRSKIDIALDQGSWRVKEISDVEGSHDIYDGAMTSSGPALIIIMKDRLMGLPRTMTVRSTGSHTYEGVATAAYFPRKNAAAISRFVVKTRSAHIALKR